MYHRSTQTSILKTFVTYSLVSILVGIVSMWLQTDKGDVDLNDYLINSVYSLLVGFSLFANSWLFSKVEVKYVSWINRPVKSLLTAVSVHLVYSTIAIYGVNYLWFVLIVGLDWHVFYNHHGKSIIIGEYIALFLISSVFYALSFFNEWRKKAVESEKLKSEAIALQYQVMQNQVNPHFLFNSLNVLGSLIDIDAEKAKQFTHELSMFYRELLSLKDKDLIPIQRELEFVKRYVFLQSIRFGTNFQVRFFIPEKLSGALIPMSLQMLVENAVKHNEISNHHPLEVIVGVIDDQQIFVENNLQPKKMVDHSHQIGLKNLKNRYQYLTGREVEVEAKENFFRVNLPIVQREI